MHALTDVRDAPVVGHPRRLRQALLTDPKQIAAARYMWSAQRPWIPEKALTRDAAMQVEQLLAEWGATGWPELDVAQRYRDAMLVPGAAQLSGVAVFSGRRGRDSLHHERRGCCAGRDHAASEARGLSHRPPGGDALRGAPES